jgi:hypothetical protein
MRSDCTPIGQNQPRTATPLNIFSLSSAGEDRNQEWGRSYSPCTASTDSFFSSDEENGDDSDNITNNNNSNNDNDRSHNIGDRKDTDIPQENKDQPLSTTEHIDNNTLSSLSNNLSSLNLKVSVVEEDHNWAHSRSRAAGVPRSSSGDSGASSPDSRRFSVRNTPKGQCSVCVFVLRTQISYVF